MHNNTRHTQSCSDIFSPRESLENISILVPKTTGRRELGFQRETQDFSKPISNSSERNHDFASFSPREHSDESRQGNSPKFENISTCSNIHPKSSSDLNEDSEMISSERKVLQDIGNRPIPEEIFSPNFQTFQGLRKPKLQQKSESIDSGRLDQILQQYHQNFGRFTENKLANFHLYKAIDDQIMNILPVNEIVVPDSERSDKENFNYLDGQAFYKTNSRFLKRSSSLKQAPKKMEDIKSFAFSDYYKRYLIPMREKIQEYAEKINWLVKEKELEFANMNEIVQRMIEDFSKEKRTFEAEMLDKNLLIAKLRETIEINNERNSIEKSNKSQKQAKRGDNINLPRQIPLKPTKSFTPTPEKLYSFRAASAQGKNRQARRNDVSPADSKMARKIGFEDSSKKMNDLNPDLINISQINFDTQGDDFSMTNPLFNDKPTSRFMDFDEVPDSHAGLLGLNGTNKGRYDLYGQNNHKNWAIKEEESFSRQGESSMISPEFDFIKTMNENLLTKMVQSDHEKTKLLDLVEKLVCDKKEKKDKKNATIGNIQLKQLELEKEKEQLEKEKKEIEEAKEALQKEKEVLEKKRESMNDIIKSIQTKNAKQLAEKDLQLLLMDKKIEAKKKSLEEELSKVNMMKKEMKHAQEAISNEWKKIGLEVKELEKLYNQYEQAKEELTNDKKEMMVQYEINLKEIQKSKKEVYEGEKRLKNERRNIQKKEEQLMKEKEEVLLLEQELQEKTQLLIQERQYFERERATKENKYGSIDSKLRALAERIKKT